MAQAAKVGDAFVEVSARLDFLERGLRTARKKTLGLGAVAMKVGGMFAVAFGARAIFRGLKGAVLEFSDATETVNKFEAVFSGIPKKAETVGKSLAKNFGLSQVSAKQLLGDTGDLLVGFGFTEDKALDLAKATNELGLDLASFTNFQGGAAGAAQALVKAFTGERESVKALGIVIREQMVMEILRRDGMDALTGLALVQAKAMATLEIATKQSGKAIGDYGRTQEELANQMRLFGQRFKDLKVAVGDLLVTIFRGKESLGAFAERMGRLGEEIQKLADSNAIRAVSVGLQRMGFEMRHLFKATAEERAAFEDSLAAQLIKHENEITSGVVDNEEKKTAARRKSANMLSGFMEINRAAQMAVLKGETAAVKKAEEKKKTKKGQAGETSPETIGALLRLPTPNVVDPQVGPIKRISPPVGGFVAKTEAGDAFFSDSQRVLRELGKIVTNTKETKTEVENISAFGQ